MLVHGNDRCADLILCGQYFAVRTRRYLYAEHNTTTWGAEQELYDFNPTGADPDQMKNVAGAARYQNVVTELQGILGTLRTCSGASCWYANEIVAAPSTLSPGRDRAAVRDGPVADIFRSRKSYDILQSGKE
jgi:hypothetical protein